MFVRKERSIARFFGELAGEFTGVPNGWLSGIAEQTLGTADGVTARMGTGRLHKKVSIQLGSVLSEDARAVMPIRVVATGPAGLFPQLDADLELLAAGPSATMLRLSGSYRVPLGPAGRLLDGVLLHRIAESSVTDFLERVSQRLERLP